jgi:hypothetical protein
MGHTVEHVTSFLKELGEDVHCTTLKDYARCTGFGSPNVITNG